MTFLPKTIVALRMLYIAYACIAVFAAGKLTFVGQWSVFSSLSEITMAVVFMMLLFHYPRLPSTLSGYLSLFLPILFFVWDWLSYQEYSGIISTGCILATSCNIAFSTVLFKKAWAEGKTLSVQLLGILRYSFGPLFSIGYTTLLGAALFFEYRNAVTNGTTASWQVILQVGLMLIVLLQSTRILLQDMPDE